MNEKKGKKESKKYDRKTERVKNEYITEKLAIVTELLPFFICSVPCPALLGSLRQANNHAAR